MLKGKTVILEFWATWCGPCVASIPHLNQLQASLALRSSFSSLSMTKTPVVEAFLQKKMVSWVGLDTSGSTFKAFGVNSRPSTIVVDKNGRIASVTTADQITRDTLLALASRAANVSVSKQTRESVHASVAQSQTVPVVRTSPAPRSHGFRNSPWKPTQAVDYFYTATAQRTRSVLSPYFYPALVLQTYHRGGVRQSMVGWDQSTFKGTSPIGRDGARWYRNRVLFLIE